MATLQDIKLRMGSVKNTQQITKAMKMVAASKMKRAEDKIKAARPYTDKLASMVANLSEGMDASAHPLLTNTKGGKAVVLLITSDRGLCGGLNTNLCKKLTVFMKDLTNIEDPNHAEEIELMTFGKKGFEFFGKRDYDISKNVKELKDDELADELVKTVELLIEGYQKGEFNSLYVAYNHFKNVITQEIRTERVLPIEAPQLEEGQTANETEYLLEPNKEAILDEMLPKYVINQAFTGLLDNQASEHASRMTAMDSASKNAGELLKSLQLQYNRARQAAITTELIEIISGAESI